MEELNNKKEKVICIFLSLIGLLLFSLGILFLITDGLTWIPFQEIGYAAIAWAFAASPKVMLRFYSG